MLYSLPSWGLGKEEDVDKEVLELRHLAKRRKIEDYYTLVKVIGEGSYSQVFEATRNYVLRDDSSSADSILTEDGRVAVKVVSKRKSTPVTFWKEVLILRSMGEHPNLIRYIDAFEDEGFYYLVTEFVEGGELFEALVHHGPYSEKQARSIPLIYIYMCVCVRGLRLIHIYVYFVSSELLRQISGALNHLHERGIAHADIKPENIILNIKDDVQSGVKLIGMAWCN